MGADLHRHDGRDGDEFDAVCDHLIVIDESQDKVIWHLSHHGAMGSAFGTAHVFGGEFRIDNLRPIARDLRSGSGLHPSGHRSSGAARLWSGLGSYVRQHGVKYLAGCASVSLDSGALERWRVAQ